MKKLILPFLIIGLFSISACGTVTKSVLNTRVETRVVEVPEALYDCPGLPPLDNIEKMTQRDVAQLLLTLAENNEKCRKSMEDIKKFLKDAKILVEK